MSKTLGQINYERFTPEWVTPLVPWHEVPVQEQQRWEAAAQAVASQVVGLRRIEAEEAVIEAARAWYEWRIGYGGLHASTEEHDLAEAIEALDKAEEPPWPDGSAPLSEVVAVSEEEVRG
jgi:hypothetical protein